MFLPDAASLARAGSQGIGPCASPCAIAQAFRWLFFGWRPRPRRGNLANASESVQEVSLGAEGSYRLAYPADATGSVAGGLGKVRLPARTARVWLRN